MSRWDQMSSPSQAVGSGRLQPSSSNPEYNSSKYHNPKGGAAFNSSTYSATPPAQSSYNVNPLNGTTSLPPSNQFTYTTGNPYTGQTGYTGPMAAERFPRPEGVGRGRGGDFRGRGRWRGRGGMAGPRTPKTEVIKPKPPPALTSLEKTKMENHNMKQVLEV